MLNEAKRGLSITHAQVTNGPRCSEDRSVSSFPVMSFTASLPVHVSPSCLTKSAIYKVHTLLLFICDLLLECGCLFISALLF